MKDAIEKYIPNTRYFEAYMQYTDGTEVCPRFRFFVAATIYGAVVNRKVWFQRGTPGVFPKLFPNLWTVLVAPQGTGKKTSALNTGRMLLLSLPLDIRPKFLASKITPEAIVNSLATHVPLPEVKIKGVSQDIYKKDAIAVVYSSELGVLLGKERYNTGLINLLTDLYDCHDEWSSETVSRGHLKLFNICLTFLAAATPDWLQSLLPKDAFKTGFMSRFLWVVLPRGWDVKVANPPAVDEGWKDVIVEELIKASEYKGEFTWTEAAERRFAEWYESIDFTSLPGVVAAAFERMQVHLLRLAMIIRMTKGGLVLEEEDIQQTIDILDSIFPESSAILEYIATEPGVRPAVRVLEELRRNPVMKEEELIRRVWRSLPRASEWSASIGLLLRSGLIHAVSLGRGDVAYALNVELDSSLSESQKKELLAKVKEEVKNGADDI